MLNVQVSRKTENLNTEVALRHRSPKRSEQTGQAENAKGGMAVGRTSVSGGEDDAMRIMLENIPASSGHRQVALIKCLDAMTGAMPVRQVVLFGSYARGNARRDSDVDLCIIADGAKNQMKAARKFRRAIRDIRPKPACTLVPIRPGRLQEKKESGDHFFATVLKEGICLAKEDRLA
jgi:predicted nucleotidyltransferase